MSHPSTRPAAPAARHLVSLLVLAAAPLGAQSASDSAAPRRLTFGIEGGFAQSPPLGPLGPGAVGYAAQAVAELRTPLPWVRLRGDGLFASWGADQRLTALTAGLVVEPATRWRALPFVSGSGGGYALPGVGRAPGWSLGAGVRVPIGRQSFVVESRMHAILVGDEAVRAALGGGWAGGDRWRYTFTPLLLGVRF